MTKSAKTRGAKSPRNTEAAQAGERAARSAATQAAADPTAANLTETPQPTESGSPLAPAELTTTGEAAYLSTGQAAQSQAELPDDEVALAEPPARPVLVSNTASPHKATLVSTGAQPPAASFGAQPPHPTRSAFPSDPIQTRRLMHRATKIVATIGPASSTPEILLKMIQAGLDVVRLNFSHGTADDHRQRAEFVREAARQAGREVAIMADLQGPKIRVGKFENGKIMLVAGEPFILDAECELGNEQRAGLDYKDLPRDLKPGDVLLLNDGLIVLDVARVIGSEIHTIVKIGGELSNNKGINRQGGGLSAPALTAKDMEDIRTAMSLGVDYVAVSFPKNATDMEMARQLANIAGAPFGIKPKMIAKIERAEAIPALQGILDASDGIMVARGDLAVEVGNAAVPALQKRMIRMARESNKFVITATQMMESMIYAPVPTRAEVSDVANAVLDGTDAVMLSAESAAGKYPVQTIETMAAICVEAEKSEQSELDKDFLDRTFTRIDQSIAMGALFTAYHLGAKAIVALTESGSTALWMSRHWTHVPIFALTPRVGSERAMALYRNVTSLHLDTNTDRDTALQQALETVVSKGYASHGDMVVLTVGEPMGQAGGTNTLKIVRVGEPY
ncbi:pyruvate kinase [Paraburkholderia sp. BL21I4N1]|nr:pyruvate kinase [Paraburkholderia sp. BL21I4N1]